MNKKHTSPFKIRKTMEKLLGEKCEMCDYEIQGKVYYEHDYYCCESCRIELDNHKESTI